MANGRYSNRSQKTLNKSRKKNRNCFAGCMLCVFAAILYFTFAHFNSAAPPTEEHLEEFIPMEPVENPHAPVVVEPLRLTNTNMSATGAQVPAVVNIPPVPKSGVPSHWTPIDINFARDPTVTLCKLDYDTYWRNPDKLPMFRDLVAASKCRGKNVKEEKLSVLKAEMEADPDGTLQPTGFVFHESRCGSTLVADMLGSQAHHLTFSESSPPAAIAGKGERHVGILRTVMLLMCRSSYHTRCFFKFQSVNAPRIRIFAAAFPETPWAFVFREPVQVMMSHFKGGTGGAVCLRARNRPEKGHRKIISELGETDHLSAEEFCAVHLAYLSECAYSAYTSTANGLLLNYEDLPEILPMKVLKDHFRAPVDSEGQARMLEVSKMYSKGRKGSPNKGEFTGDNEKKQKAASTAVKDAATRFLYPSYRKLSAASVHPAS